MGSGQKRKQNGDQGGRKGYNSSHAEMWRTEGEKIKCALEGELDHHFRLPEGGMFQGAQWEDII
eukprot:3131159-Ditylum_brightwellii.AAC.1